MSNSIGNLKNSGLQGNNFPWQLKMLQGLQAIYDEVKLPLTCAEDGVTICAPTGGLDVNLHDGSGTPITSTPDALGNTGIDVNIVGPIGQQSINSSVAVTLASEQANVQITPMVLDITGAAGNLTAYSGSQLLSISFASRGTAPVDLSVDGNVTLFRLLPGETLNMDANGVMNYYDPTLFYWDASAAGAAVLIAFNYI